jgi:hypothetical protein
MTTVSEEARQDDVGRASGRVGDGDSAGVAAGVNVEGGGVGRKHRLWDVSVEGYGEAIFEATTRGKAIAAAWRCDAFGHVPFKRFLSMARARLRRDPPPTDGYSYVRERYGMDPKMGERAQLTDGESWRFEGREGVILWGGQGRCNHIRILLDGMKEPLNVHPSNVILLPSSASETTASQDSTQAAPDTAPSVSTRLSASSNGTPATPTAGEG